MELLRKKTCNSCKQEKYYNNLGNGMCEFPDNPNSFWRTSICSDCGIARDNRIKINKERNRLFAPASAIGERELKVCKCCNKTLERFYFGKNSHNSGIYKSEDGRHWHGRICPDCYNIREQEKRARKVKPPRPVYTNSCPVCSNEFQTIYKKQVCCSNACKTQKSRLKPRITKCSKCNSVTEGRKRLCDSCKPARIPKAKVRSSKPLHKKNCITCGAEFETKQSNRLSCKPSHTPSSRKAHKKSKVIRKSKMRQKISLAYASQIMEFYDNRNGKQVDHIIPLNHPDVCGLHVPWNLQYLDSRTNMEKTNLWDWTMDNLGWHDLLKGKL